MAREAMSPDPADQPGLIGGFAIWKIETGDARSMYVISLDHYLDAKGAIALENGPGRKIADFAVTAVAYASNRNRPDDASRPTCFKCRNPKHSAVDIGLTETGLVAWRCHACGNEGQISNWRGTFRDLSQGVPTK